MDQGIKKLNRNVVKGTLYKQELQKNYRTYEKKIAISLKISTLTSSFQSEIRLSQKVGKYYCRNCLF